MAMMLSNILFYNTYEGKTSLVIYVIYCLLIRVYYKSSNMKIYRMEIFM